MAKIKATKLLVLLLVVCMLISILIGCSSSDLQSSNQGSTVSNESEDQKTSGNSSSSSGDKNETSGKSEKVTIELVTGDNVVLPPDEENFMNKALNEALNIDITLTIMGAGEDYATALNTRISGGDVPDMFVVPSKHAFQQYADSGLLMSLSPYLDKIQPVVEWVGGPENLTPNIYKGEMYRVPKKGQGAYNIWSIRKDWLDAVGAQIPTTPEEALDVAKKFTFEDPDGNGKDDTFGLSGAGLAAFDAILNAYGGSIANHIIIRNNEITSSLFQSNMKAGLEMCKAFVDAGAVDPDMVANNGTTARDKMVQGMTGMVFYDWASLYKKMFMDQVLAVNPDANWVWFENLKGPEGSMNGVLDVSNVAGRWVISKEVEEDEIKRDRIFDLLNYVVSQEGLNLVSYGIEGRHFNIQNGDVVPTELMSKECDFLWSYQICFRDDLTYCQTKFPEARDAVAFAYEMERYEVYDEAVDIPDGFHKADMDRYIQDNMIKFIYGARPVDEYDAFLQELKDSFQIDVYMKTAETQLKEKGYIK